MPFQRVVKHYAIRAGYSRGREPAVWKLKEKAREGKQPAVSAVDNQLMLGRVADENTKEEFDLFITPKVFEDVIVFGKVIMGQDVVQEIEKVDADVRYIPLSYIEIQTVTLEQNI
ncbi:hypothetical protein OROHE_024979 [Orobanche hederae]